IKMIKITVTSFTVPSSDPINDADNGAPKIDDASALCANSGDIPASSFSPEAMSERPFSTRKSEKKIGICSSRGRHEENGLVPDFLYSAICSCAIAWREAESVLPLYFA